MTITDPTTPVVVLKLEHYGSLGIFRSLGKLGIPVYGIDSNPNAIAFSSKYCSGKFVWDIDRASPASILHFLMRVGETIGRRSLLIPTTDEMAIFVAQYADVLRTWYIFPVQSRVLIRSLCNKKEMFFLAKKYGVQTAQTEFPQSKKDALEFVDRATFPLMLKGINGGRLEKRTGKKMVIARTKQDFLEMYDAMEEPANPNLMIQEYIPGEDDTGWMFNGYFDHSSHCLLEFTGKKIRQNPVYTGMTSLGICLSNPKIAQISKQFMKAVGYRGILDIDYLFDSRDGEYKILDINPRVGATFRLFVGQGEMDVVRAFYLDSTGQQVPHDILTEGRKWFVEDKDLKSCYQYFLDGKLNFRDWISSFRGIEEAGYFEMEDLLPFIEMGISHIFRQFHRIAWRSNKKSFHHHEGTRVVLS